MSIHIEDTETISPEDNFDNGLILDYIERKRNQKPRHFEIR